MDKLTIKTDDGAVHIDVNLYKNKGIALTATCDDGMPYATLSTNLPDAEIADDEVCIANWNIPEDFLNALLASGRFRDTGQTRTSGYATASVWTVTCPALLADVAQRRRSL